MSDSVVPALKVSVRQVSSSPPKLAIGVTNTHSGPVTVLTWDSPLDPLALQLGLLSFTPSGSDSPVDIPTIQVRRMMPPKADSLVTIEPGQTEERQVELKEPVVPLKQLGSNMSAVCKGQWTSVWPLKADEVTVESLGSVGASEDAFQGSFESPAVDIEV
ncbi:Uu.00g077050.m01.CDS01 [Anthostomella pinea]|uniref:Uu.00g077050.m01.CDS01 n=1 Tax=Anthostomella pinea TaxID=933095 RepID=A0AAI8YPC2_9PEZI|nr:Uu.00g077050.m01.CDS01 [Anthostomella pinea]